MNIRKITFLTVVLILSLNLAASIDLRSLFSAPDSGLEPVVGDNSPQDLTGDGIYTDVNGDGELSVSDRQAFFENRESEVIQNNKDNFDYDRDGDVDLADIQVLNDYASNPNLIVGDYRPRDLDGDGLYEDIDGDGELTVGDAQVFMDNRNSDTVENNVDKFDFNQDGEIVLDDVETYEQEYINNEDGDDSDGSGGEIENVNVELDKNADHSAAEWWLDFDLTTSDIPEFSGGEVPDGCPCHEVELHIDGEKEWSHNPGTVGNWRSNLLNHISDIDNSDSASLVLQVNEGDANNPDWEEKQTINLNDKIASALENGPAGMPKTVFNGNTYSGDENSIDTVSYEDIGFIEGGASTVKHTIYKEYVFQNNLNFVNEESEDIEAEFRIVELSSTDAGSKRQTDWWHRDIHTVEAGADRKYVISRGSNLDKDEFLGADYIGLRVDYANTDAVIEESIIRADIEDIDNMSNPPDRYEYNWKKFGEIDYEPREAGDGNDEDDDNSEEIPPITGENSPSDIDNDGLYEDVDGNGMFNVTDARVLFNKKDSEIVESYAENFNFGGEDTSEITIFDVQALYLELSERGEDRPLGHLSNWELATKYQEVIEQYDENSNYQVDPSEVQSAFLDSEENGEPEMIEVYALVEAMSRNIDTSRFIPDIEREELIKNYLGIIIEYDDNSNGRISLTETRETLDDWRANNITTDEMRAVVAVLQNDINYTKVVGDQNRLSVVVPNNEEVINSTDADKDGKISRSELRGGIEAWRGNEINTDQLRAIITVWRAEDYRQYLDSGQPVEDHIRVEGNTVTAVAKLELPNGCYSTQSSSSIERDQIYFNLSAADTSEEEEVCTQAVTSEIVREQLEADSGSYAVFLNIEKANGDIETVSDLIQISQQDESTEILNFQENHWTFFNTQSEISSSQLNGCGENSVAYLSGESGRLQTADFSGEESLESGSYFVFTGSSCQVETSTSEISTTGTTSFEGFKFLGLEESVQSSKFSECGQMVFYTSDDRNRLSTFSRSDVDQISSGKYLTYSPNSCAVDLPNSNGNNNTLEQAEAFCQDVAGTSVKRACEEQSGSIGYAYYANASISPETDSEGRTAEDVCGTRDNQVWILCETTGTEDQPVSEADTLCQNNGYSSAASDMICTIPSDSRFLVPDENVEAVYNSSNATSNIEFCESNEVVGCIE